MHSSAAVLVVFGAVLATVNGAVTKKEPGKGYFDAPSYPQQSAPAYAPQQPPVYYQPVYQPPQYALPNVDVNYCTVHSSFPLVERRHHHRRDRRQSGYGSVPAPSSPVGNYPSAPSYGSTPNYGPAPFPSPFTGHHRSQRYEREHCRYTAIWDQASCQTCCRIASAAAGTDTSMVTGALFVFDPKLERGSFDKDRSDSKEDDKDDDKDKRVLQCICCLPKPV